MSTENQLRELLLPVFGLDSIDDIQPTASLVNDIGADSLDFVEIFYIVEQNFDVTLSSKEVIIGGHVFRPEDLFVDGLITEEKATEIYNKAPEAKDLIKPGMTRAQLFTSISVRDLASVIDLKKSAQ